MWNRQMLLPTFMRKKMTIEIKQKVIMKKKKEKKKKKKPATICVAELS